MHRILSYFRIVEVFSIAVMGLFRGLEPQPPQICPSAQVGRKFQKEEACTGRLTPITSTDSKDISESNPTTPTIPLVSHAFQSRNPFINNGRLSFLETGLHYML